MATKVKITVLKKMTTQEVFGNKCPVELPPDLTPDCPKLSLGQEFILSETGECPPNLCGWAYADIHKDITHLRLGGDFPWIKNKGVMISCCTDGLRPVFFKLERIE